VVSRTIGGHQQTRGQRLAVAEFKLDAIFARFERLHVESVVRTHPAGAQDALDAGSLKRLPQRPLHQIVFDDIAQLLAPFAGRIEIDRCTAFGIPYVHARIRAGARFADGRPDVQIIQQLY
jgi:hypothetical protein